MCIYLYSNLFFDDEEQQHNHNQLELSTDTQSVCYTRAGAHFLFRYQFVVQSRA